jgi:uncharacterized protein YndB with AHSA1/START domain
MNNLFLKIERQFRTSSAEVFDTFTLPGKMKVWWTEDTLFDIDLKMGGDWIITRKEGDAIYIMRGKYLEITPPNRLKFTIGMPQFSPNYDEVSIDLFSVGHERCQMVFIQAGPEIAQELSSLEEGASSGSETGWNQAFDLMEAAWSNE